MRILNEYFLIYLIFIQFFHKFYLAFTTIIYNFYICAMIKLVLMERSEVCKNKGYDRKIKKAERDKWRQK